MQVMMREWEMILAEPMETRPAQTEVPSPQLLAATFHLLPPSQIRPFSASTVEGTSGPR